MKSVLSYFGASILIWIGYILTSVVVGFLLEFLLSFITGWARHILPYTMAMVAGGMGITVGFIFAAKWFEELSPRRLAWIFFGVLGFLTAVAAFVAMKMSIELTLSTLRDTVQAATAVITGWILTKNDGYIGFETFKIRV
jgi:hypothetical protein